MIGMAFAVPNPKKEPHKVSEPTNSPLPVVVGFCSVPGGTGCTTLATHAATFAARQGLRTLAISIDPSADMLCRMGVDDDELYIDAHYAKEDRLNLAFMPPELWVYDVRDALPNLGFGGEHKNPEIIILDMGPGATGPFRADFWVVPIQDSRSLASIEQRTFPLGISKTLFVLSQVPIIAHRRFRESARDCLKTVNPQMAQLLSSDIPRSGLLRRTASERKTIWHLTKRSLTTLKVETFCRELLGKVVRGMDAIFEADDDALIAQALAVGIGAPLANAPVSPPFGDHFAWTILTAGDGMTAYRLVQERAGALFYAPSLDKPPLSLTPFEREVVPPGTYGVTYVDAEGNEIVRARPIFVTVESREELQAGIETNPPTQDKPDRKQQELKRRIDQGFQRELERLQGIRTQLDSLLSSPTVVEPPSDQEVKKALEDLVEKQGPVGKKKKERVPTSSPRKKRS